MKKGLSSKIIGLALSAAMVLAPTPTASAVAVGEVVNHTLYTDIVAYIDGQPIESYNIDGETAIVAEQLIGYGFNVTWNAEERSLSITEGTRLVPKRDVTVLDIPPAIIGKKKSEVYYTDIVTYIDGAPVKSYNVGGSTIIIFDSLSAFGDISWQSDERTISFTRKLSEEEFPDEVIRLINAERDKEGLSALEKDEGLTAAATLRAEEISRDGCFSHTRPDGSSCFTVIKELDIGDYSVKGENIARGYRTPQTVMSGWMNSEGHRANILNSRYNRVGVGVYKKDNTFYWIQFFGTSKAITE